MTRIAGIFAAAACALAVAARVEAAYDLVFRNGTLESEAGDGTFEAALSLARVQK